jgi:hypothetical protein
MDWIYFCSPNCYAWWEAVGTWVSGLATVGAVIAAIRLANRDNTVRLRARATVGVMIGGSLPQMPADQYARCVWINVTNVGRRTVTVTTLGWRPDCYTTRFLCSVATTIYKRFFPARRAMSRLKNRTVAEHRHSATSFETTAWHLRTKIHLCDHC